MDTSIFDPSIDIQMDENAPAKYPALNRHYEAVNAKGLYFLGSNAHAADKFRFGSAGGFIHGFRYIARALHKIFRHEFEGDPMWKGQSTAYDWPAPHNPGS